MPRRSQPRTDIPDEQRPPWPDQFTQSQYDRPDQMTPGDRASPSRQAYAESEGPEVSGIEAENFEQNSAAAEKASALAERTRNRAQSIASQLESFTRRKPFSALASAFVAGIVFVLLGRRRRS